VWICLFRLICASLIAYLLFRGGKRSARVASRSAAAETCFNFRDGAVSDGTMHSCASTRGGVAGETLTTAFHQLLAGIKARATARSDLRAESQPSRRRLCRNDINRRFSAAERRGSESK